MLKKTITYTDYNGTERKEDFYFNMSKAELMEMELGTDGGMENLIQTVIDKQDIPRIMSIFKEIILKPNRRNSSRIEKRNCRTIFN